MNIEVRAVIRKFHSILLLTFTSCMYLSLPLLLPSHPLLLAPLIANARSLSLSLSLSLSPLVVYGVTTGFGKFANVVIPNPKLV